MGVNLQLERGRRLWGLQWGKDNKDYTGISGLFHYHGGTWQDAVCSPIRDPECSARVYVCIFSSKKAGTFLFSALKLPLLISRALEGEGEAEALIKESG